MTVFGIRPDFIRSSLILKKLKAHPKVELQFVYTGQHYDENLKGIFFRELGISEPQFNLDTKAGSHPQQHSKLISQLEPVIEEGKPDVVMFLGDANAVIGCITPLKMGIPIAHVEAGMRSHDWRMPEERNRVIIDRVSDVLYAYQHDYKCKLVQEGIDPTKIVVTGNTIVDILDEYKDRFNWPVDPMKNFELDSYILKDGVSLQYKKFALMTMHRDERMKDHVGSADLMMEINEWASCHEIPVVLPLMPRLKQLMEQSRFKKRLGGDGLTNFVFTKPLGFFEFVMLEKGALIEFTDSGTNQETTALLGTPCVVLRRSTERPETFKSGITVMTDKPHKIYHAADYVISQKKNPNFSLGDGNAADIIVTDLLDRLKNNFYRGGRAITNAFRAENWKSF